MILLCAATGAEHDACVRGIAGRPGLGVLLTGVGAVHATAALEAALASARPALVVSTGFAGALTDALSIGTWVTARSLVDAPGEIRPAPAPAVACAFVSSDTLVQGQALPGDAVDMESLALARVTARHAVPLMVLRLVTDTPRRPLPPLLAPFTAALAATSRRARLGHVAAGVRAAVRDPRGVGRLVREGRAWTRELEDGWRTFAPALDGARLA